jgi:branched-chain amino acid transport system substrate-binding protein
VIRDPLGVVLGGRTRRTTKIVVCGMAGLALALTACSSSGSSSSSSSSSSPISLGTVMPLSGEQAAIGAKCLSGITAAIDAKNATGGVNGRKVNLTKLDDGFVVPQTLADIKELAQQDGVAGVIGPLGTNAAVAAVATAESLKVPLIGSFAYASTLYTPTHPYVFPLFTGTTEISEAETAYAINTLHAKKIAVVANDGEVGNETFAGAEEAAKAGGATIVTELRVTDGQPDYSGLMGQVKATNPDAVVIQALVATEASMVTAATRLGMTSTPFLGGISGADSTIVPLGGSALNGRLYGIAPTQLIPADPGWTAYTAALKKYSPSADAANINVGGCYTAAVVALEGLAQIPSGTKVTPASLQAAMIGHNFQTLFGTVNYTTSSHIGLRTLYLTLVKNGQLTLTGVKFTAG